MRRFTNKNLAFTLIELLVAIAIIIALAAVLFPIFATVREKGRQTVCISNQRQIGAAILLYAQDYEEHLPIASLTIAGLGVRGPIWALILTPYQKDYNLLACPTDTIELDPEVLRGSDDDRLPQKVSYIYNEFLGGNYLRNGKAVLNNMENKSIGEVNRPTSTVMLTDGGTTAIAGIAPIDWKPKKHHVFAPYVLADATISGVFSAKADDPRAPCARHSSKTNVVFADGHTKSLAIEAFFVSPGQTAPNETRLGYSPCLDPAKGCP